MVHLIKMIKKVIRNGLSTLVLQIAIFCFFWIIVLVVMTVCGWKNFGYWFWGLECMALSGLLLYTMFLVLMGERHLPGLDNFMACGFKLLGDDRDAQDKLNEADRTNLRLSSKAEEDDIEGKTPGYYRGFNFVMLVSVLVPLFYLGFLAYQAFKG